MHTGLAGIGIVVFVSFALLRCFAVDPRNQSHYPNHTVRVLRSSKIVRKIDRSVPRDHRHVLQPRGFISGGCDAFPLATIPKAAEQRSVRVSF